MCQCVNEKKLLKSIKKEIFSGYMVAGCFSLRNRHKPQGDKFNLKLSVIVQRGERKKRKYPSVPKQLLELAFPPPSPNPQGSATH